MQPLSIVSVFCEDVREEKSGQATIVGVLPDNLNVGAVPVLMPKLGIYIRVHLDSAGPRPQSMSAKLVASDGSEITLPSWDQSTINKGFDDSNSNGMPLVGLVLTAVMAPFPIQKSGVFVTKVNVDGAEYIGSNLNVTAISSNAPPPPASQSPPAVPAL